MAPIIAIPESETSVRLKVYPLHTIHIGVLFTDSTKTLLKKGAGERKIKSSSCLGVFNVDVDLQADANCLMLHPPLWYTEDKC